ncbi:hypothetical protein AVL62_12085 [Serinicoccus chungangensis]|uniref:HTH cro/C1-type domain-containing protein n=1 Tax=Serinicoccus chungangensis TaxID=767452 RepID=A0A0W8IAC6_9MICO|nr:helix-turn-helix transcriptional regulator [Serinicoccus chungangensis]KUG56862.1 hypothetical protein AVL62_12085 [Serinicoccus chungangensis]
MAAIDTGATHVGDGEECPDGVPTSPGSEVAGPRRPGAAEQVGLALRAFRRERGWSQRALAQSWGVHQSLVARAERHAEQLTLDVCLELLRRAGVGLAVLGPDGMPVISWEEADLVAVDRSGRRFPAHRAVRPSTYGPRWWWFHDYFGGRSSGPRPRWTAEGFAIPPGVRYGKQPRPQAPGEGPRWPG